MNKCLKCNEPAVGMDDLHCDDHWLELCEDGWQEMWRKVAAVESAFNWKLARDKARSLHPDFDQLPSFDEQSAARSPYRKVDGFPFPVVKE